MARRIDLDALGDDALLDLRLRDLPVSMDGTWVAGCVDRLHGELAARGLRFKPSVWLSSEWFSPDDVPGIAVPFYLAHPRLMRLEKKQLLSVEGGTKRACMRLLRHEAGHAIDTAFGFRRRKAYREAFGRFGTPYPDTYRPKPRSRDFVLHLDGWYAQAHPAEDFAETFAVWLTPRGAKAGAWRTRYAGWPALRKLEALDAMMVSVRGEAPRNRARRRVEPLRELGTTLREHYRQRRMRYLVDWPDVVDGDLKRLFSSAEAYRYRASAAGFIRKVRPEVRESVAKWTGTHPYTIDQVLKDMIDRCKELKLRLKAGESQTRTDLLIVVAVQTTNYLNRGAQPLAV